MEKTNKNRQEEKIIRKMRRPLWLRITRKIIGISIIILIAFIGFQFLFHTYNAEAVPTQADTIKSLQEPDKSTSQNAEKSKAESKVKQIQEKTNKQAKQVQKEYKAVQQDVEDKAQDIEDKFKENQEKIKEVQSQFPSLDLKNDSMTETEQAIQDLYDQVDAAWQDEEEVVTE